MTRFTSWVVGILLPLQLAYTSSAIDYTPIQPPSYPLAVRNPYLSAWLPGDQVAKLPTAQPQFWYGSNLGWSVLANVDRQTYNLFGVSRPAVNTKAATVVKASFTSTHSIFVVTAGNAQFTLDFFSPVSPKDYVRQSLPFSYLSITTSTNQPFIFALGPTGSAISSDSTSESIRQHSMYDSFTLDMQQASFSGSDTPALSPSSGAASSDSGSGSASSSSSSDTAMSSGGSNTYNMVHGIFMSIAFVILFPLGVLVLRLGHSVIGHGIIQALAYCFVIVGLGTGIYLSQQDPSTRNYNSAHQIIGLVLFSLLAIQALGGLLHHLLFRRGKNSIIGKVHMILGIGLLILGIVNAPLGLNLAGDSKYNKYYIIVVAILGALFLALSSFVFGLNQANHAF
ncbi:CBD9-like protein [Aureobasidium pullulans]|uniref:CBD9-like protein n=1 Tax=Aureobasidium pullulans TaxID=5580 RepID=A0A4T0A8S8_AURPU|nr:CBD9-like protein [Aureobasidium pullulans]